MSIGTSSSVVFLGLLSLCGACSSEDDPGPGGGGTAGTTAAGGSSAGSGAGGSVTGGGGKGGSAGAGGSSASGGAGGSTTVGGNATGGTSAQGGVGGSGQSGNGAGGRAGSGNGGSAGGPPSMEGLPFVGSCSFADHCTDEWDKTLGAALLEQLCVGQQGTWSTGHCATAGWKKKCTQAVTGGVYVQYMKEDGVCVLGFEEAL